MVIAVFASNASAPSYASYDQPIIWNNKDHLDLALESINVKNYPKENLFQSYFSDEDLALVLKDVGTKISSEFHVPAGMMSAVDFWLKVYTRYTSQHFVLFDSHHHEIVYEVVAFRDIAKKAKNWVAYETTQRARMDALLDAYQKAFKHLIRNPRPKQPTREERLIISAVKRSKHRHSYRELLENFKSQVGQRETIVRALMAAEAYFPKMEELFDRFELPRELTRLTLIESSFKLNARSPVGALGVWQFMPRPGKEFMLIDDKVDERLSPLKATVAAARLLRENHTFFGSWPLAITSYNHGLKGLIHLKKQRQDEYARIAHLFIPCKNKSPLGWQSRNYYAEFLAVVHATAYKSLFYGLLPSTTSQAVTFKRIDETKTGKALAMENGLSIREFSEFNPDIKILSKKLPKNFLIALPSNQDNLTVLVQTESRTAKSSDSPSIRRGLAAKNSAVQRSRIAFNKDQ